MGRKSCFILIIVLLCTSAIAGMQPITNPYTGKPDYVGDDDTEFPMGCTSASDWCLIYEDSVVKMYVGAVLQAQWPIEAAEYHLLLDDGLGGFKLLLDDGVGGFFLKIK